MPIYEYSCAHCRMIYQFFVRSIRSTKAPQCPRCGATDLKRLLSSFVAVTGVKSRDARRREDAPSAAANEGHPPPGGGEKMPGDPFENMTPERQARAEQEMMSLMSQAEGMDENDPRQMGHFMDRMMRIVGQDGNPEVKEAIRRLKAGENPEKIEAELGDVLGLGGAEAGEGGSSTGGYGHDSNLYEM